MKDANFQRLLNEPLKWWNNLPQAQKQSIKANMSGAQRRIFENHLASMRGNIMQKRISPVTASQPGKQSTDNAYDDYFIYTVNVGTVSAGTTSTVNLQTDSDADFQWLKSSYTLSGLGAPSIYQPTSQLQIKVTDLGNGRQLMNSDVYLDLLCGAFGLPFINPLGHIFAANSTIEFDFKNPSAAHDCTNVFFSMIGTKRFFYGS